MSQQEVDPKILKRSMRHLIPIEVLCSKEVHSDVPPAVVLDTPLVNHSEEMAEGANEALPLSDSRPRRQAAINPTKLDWTLTVFAPICAQTGGLCKIDLLYCRFNFCLYN